MSAILNIKQLFKLSATHIRNSLNINLVKCKENVSRYFVNGFYPPTGWQVPAFYFNTMGETNNKAGEA